MAKVITEGSTIKCPHQGTVKFTASQQKLKVGGQAVLVSTDAMSGVIRGCKTQLTSTTQPCLKVVSLISDPAKKLTVDQIPVLLDTATGLTDGKPPASWSVQSAEQTKLDAV